MHIRTKLMVPSPSAELDRRMSGTLAAAAQMPRSSRRIPHLWWLVALTAAGTVAGFLLMFPKARPQQSRPVVYRNAVEIVHALAGFKLNRDQDDYLELMAKIIEDYERETSPEPAPVTGVESLKYLLKENGLSADDLGTIIGVDRSIAYRILKGSRNLTAEHIKKLSSRFVVSADLFLA